MRYFDAPSNNHVGDAHVDEIPSLRLQSLVHNNYVTWRVAATKLRQTEDFRQKFAAVPPKDTTI